MTETEIYYVIKVGNMYLGNQAKNKGEGRRQVDLTEIENDARLFSADDDSLQYKHRTLIHYVSMLNGLGLGNVSIIEKKTVTMKTNKEVELMVDHKGEFKLLSVRNNKSTHCGSSDTCYCKTIADCSNPVAPLKDTYDNKDVSDFQSAINKEDSTDE